MSRDASAELVLVEEKEYLIPEDRALAMIEACANSIREASTIPDVKKVITHASAIEAVVRKIKASEQTKVVALRLIIEAEAQLGRLTKQLPHGKRGGAAHSDPGQVTKRKLLHAHGLNHFRCAVAEKLADASPAQISAAIDATKSKTLRGVNVELGFYKPFNDKSKAPKNMRTIAMNAIALLVRCQSQGRAPTAEEVNPLREAFSRENAQNIVLSREDLRG